jgi:hypothetical protein
MGVDCRSDRPEMSTLQKVFSEQLEGVDVESLVAGRMCVL